MSQDRERLIGSLYGKLFGRRSPEEAEETENEKQALEAEPEEDDDPGYEETEWKGYPYWKCTLKDKYGNPCGFGAFREDVVQMHVWKFHQIPESLARTAAEVVKTKPLEAELYGPDNKLIDERTMTPEEISEEQDLRHLEPPETLTG